MLVFQKITYAQLILKEILVDKTFQIPLFSIKQSVKRNSLQKTETMVANQLQRYNLEFIESKFLSYFSCLSQNKYQIEISPFFELSHPTF